MAQTTHAGIKLSEVLPASLDHISGVSSSSAMVSRKRIKIVPQTSTAAGPGDVMNFLIQDPGFLDLRSAVFHANITVATSTADVLVALDDGPAWLRQLVIQVDGQNLETLDRVNKVSNMETYMTCNKALYDRALSFAGYYKYSADVKPLVLDSRVGGQYLDVAGNIGAASFFYEGAGGVGYDIGLPLGLVSHVFRSRRLFPSRFANNLSLQFQLESAATACVCSTATAANLTYSLTNVYLEVDSITLNPAFTAFIQDQIMSPDGDGIVLPFNTKISSMGNAQTNNGENTFVVSRASKNLKRIAVAQQLTSVLGSSTPIYPEVSTFPSAGFNQHRFSPTASPGQIQLLVAGNYYPQFPQQGTMAFWGAHAAYNGSAITDGDGGIVSYRTWGTTTNAAGDGITLGSGPFTDSWIWAYDLSKHTGTSDPLENDGVDSTGNAQVQITIRTAALENGVATPVSFTPLVELLGTKYVKLSQGQLQIMG